MPILLPVSVFMDTVLMTCVESVARMVDQRARYPRSRSRWRIALSR
jgi:hypothetical protein